MSSVRVGSRSPLAFQGTPDDARTLLFGITGTMITVIALLLGLAVVALQLPSTQFSPQLPRNFLRDRPNQVVLSAFVATFAYSAGRAVHGRRHSRFCPTGGRRSDSAGSGGSLGCDLPAASPELPARLPVRGHAEVCIALQLKCPSEGRNSSGP
jgi:hypothetical protein